MNEKKPRCYNCIHKSESFKIGKLTHLHCMNPDIYKIEGFESGQTSAWDTLRVFSDTCDKHEPKPLILHDVSVPKETLRHKAKALTKEEVEANRSSAYDYLDL